MTRTSLAVVALLLAACAGTEPVRRAPVARAPETPAAAPDVAQPAMPAVSVTPAVPAPVAPAAADPSAPRNYETIRIKVAGMTCPIRCVREVKEQLEAVTGVLHVTIDSDRREAIVDIAAGTNPDDVLAGLRTPYAGRLL